MNAAISASVHNINCMLAESSASRRLHSAHQAITLLRLPSYHIFKPHLFHLNPLEYLLSSFISFPSACKRHQKLFNFVEYLLSLANAIKWHCLSWHASLAHVSAGTFVGLLQPKDDKISSNASYIPIIHSSFTIFSWIVPLNYISSKHFA